MTAGDKIVLCFGVFLIACAIVWRLALVVWKRRHDAVVAGYVRVRGVVTDNYVDGSGSDTGYYQVVSYEVDGAQYQYTHVSRAYRPWPVGEPFELAYDPAQPTTAVEADYDDSWDKKLTVALSVGGLVFIGAAWVG